MSAHFFHLLEELRRRAARMASLVEDMVQEACEAVVDGDVSLAKRVIARDAEVDREEVEVESDVIRLLALYQPVGADLRLLCAVLKTNNDLERIADCAVNLAERARYLEDRASVGQRESLKQMGLLTRRMLRGAIQAFVVADVGVAKDTAGLDDRVDDLYEQIIKEIVAEGAGSGHAMAASLDVLSVAKNLERIADHATNISEDVVFLATGRIVRHTGGETDEA